MHIIVCSNFKNFSSMEKLSIGIRRNLIKLFLKKLNFLILWNWPLKVYCKQQLSMSIFNYFQLKDEFSVAIAVRLHKTLELAGDKFYMITCGKAGFQNTRYFCQVTKIIYVTTLFASFRIHFYIRTLWKVNKVWYHDIKRLACDICLWTTNIRITCSSFMFMLIFNYAGYLIGFTGCNF